MPTAIEPTIRIATPKETAAITNKQGAATASSKSQPEPWEIRTFADAMKSPDEKPPWVIEGLLTKQSATLVAALPHAMKSFSWLQACLEAVEKKTVWGYFPAPNVQNTLFIETEDPDWLVKQRIQGIARGLGFDENQTVPGFHWTRVGPFDVLQREGYIRGLIKELGLDFIVISTLQNLLENRSLTDQEDMQPITAMILRLSRECPIVLLTHSPWDKRQKRAMGSVTLTANFLTTMHYEKFYDRKADETTIHILADSKVEVETDFYLNLIVRLDAVTDEVRSVHLVYGDKGYPKGSGRAAVESAIAEDPDASAKEIAERTGVSDRYVRKIKEEMYPEHKPQKQKPQKRSEATK